MRVASHHDEIHDTAGIVKRVLLLLAFVSAACGSSAAGPRAVTTGQESGAPENEAGAAADAASDDASAVPTSCGDQPDVLPPGSTCVLEAKGRVEDLSGAPLSKIPMTFCGAQCFGSPSDANGSFAIGVGMFLPTADYALHADGRPDHAVDYLRFTANEPPVIDATMRIPTLPPSSVDLPPDGAAASSVTVGDVTLLVPDQTTFDLSIEDYNVTRALRVVSVRLADAPSYAAAAQVNALYALAPSGCLPTKKLGVVLKNSAGLPASAAVEFLVLSDDYSADPPTVGLLQVQAKGHVSADAATIQTDPGEGISELTWLAVRKAN
jgi:hypothetical protein